MKYNKQEFCDASDEVKIKIVEEELRLETHNGTTKDDLLMLLEWTYYRAIKKDLCSDNCWIPVKKRLPEENQEVWITTKYGEVKRAMYTEHLGNNEVKIFLLIGGSENIDEVSAWQPYYVPEPYRTEND